MSEKNDKAVDTAHEFSGKPAADRAGMTYIGLVHEYFPDIGDGLCDFILWNLTSFPFGDEKELREHLAHIKEVGIQQAIDEADAALLSLNIDEADAALVSFNAEN